MDVASIRRYLQPSPTLRWHPWAPLVALTLALAFVFGLGVAAGMKYEQRRERPSHYSPAIFDVMTQQEASIRPTAVVIRRAQRIDNAVEHWVHEREHRTVVEAAMDAIEPYFRPERMSRMKMEDALHESVRRVAEWRLANLAAGAPAWQQTAAYCDEWKATYVVGEPYERAARAYTALLGREITAAQLAPAVPGGKCNGKEKP